MQLESICPIHGSFSYAEILYSFTAEVKNRIKNCLNRQKTAEKHGKVAKLEEEKRLEEALREELKEKEHLVKNDPGKVLNSATYLREFAGEKTKDELVEDKLRQLKEKIGLAERLELQGIDIEKWRNTEKGLSFGEIQIGIKKFVDTYTKENTVFINNGEYFCEHYMKKEHLVIKPNASTIDLTKCYSGDFCMSMDDIRENYIAKTGKDIKVFDALTKCLCFAEIISKETEVGIKNTSEKYVGEQVKLEAVKNRGDCVLTYADLLTSEFVMDVPKYRKDIPCFSSLEYVDFGTDRRYVDLDRMFRMNGNFEITLDGDKEPIKTWEELECKITALNGEISPVLLEHIKEKYEEMQKTAEAQKNPFIERPKNSEEIKTPGDKSNNVQGVRTKISELLEKISQMNEIDEQINFAEQKVESVREEIRATAHQINESINSAFGDVLKGLSASDCVLEEYNEEKIEEELKKTGFAIEGWHRSADNGLAIAYRIMNPTSDKSDRKWEYVDNGSPISEDYVNLETLKEIKKLSENIDVYIDKIATELLKCVEKNIATKQIQLSEINKQLGIEWLERE